MSDPAMAASMEADIRTRFWVAIVLSALIVVISPMGAMIGIRLPLSDAVRSWTLLGLTTPIVFWCGWIFVAGAFRSLASRRRWNLPRPHVAHLLQVWESRRAAVSRGRL